MAAGECIFSGLATDWELAYSLFGVGLACAFGVGLLVLGLCWGSVGTSVAPVPPWQNEILKEKLGPPLGCVAPAVRAPEGQSIHQKDSKQKTEGEVSAQARMTSQHVWIAAGVTGGEAYNNAFKRIKSSLSEAGLAVSCEQDGFGAACIAIFILDSAFFHHEQAVATLRACLANGVRCLMVTLPGVVFSPKDPNQVAVPLSKMNRLLKQKASAILEFVTTEPKPPEVPVGSPWRKVLLGTMNPSTGAISLTACTPLPLAGCSNPCQGLPRSTSQERDTNCPSGASGGVCAAICRGSSSGA